MKNVNLPAHSATSGLTYPLRDVAVRLHPEDDVAIAKVDLEQGNVLDLGSEAAELAEIRIRELVPSGHKVACVPSRNTKRCDDTAR
jgi:hypothetical protein